VAVVNFRVASTQRRFDSKTQTWIDTGTNWYNVSAFRQLADHVKSSLHQGDGVIVTGKLKLREWENSERKGMSADIDAEAIGHDLRWGASAFAKASRPSAAQDSVPADVDPETGEVLDAGPDAESDDEVDSEHASSTDPAMALASNPWSAGD
jgi:single-strand DNA-binding protein